MKTNSDSLTKVHKGFKAMLLILFCFTAMNCSDDDTPTSDIFDPCENVETIGGNLLLNGEEVPISSARLTIEERTDGFTFFSFNIRAAESNCRKLYSVGFTVRVSEELNPSVEGNYNFRLSDELQEGDLTAYAAEFNVSNNNLEASHSVSSGTLEITSNDINNYTLDIKIASNDGLSLDMLATHQF